MPSESSAAKEGALGAPERTDPVSLYEPDFNPAAYPSLDLAYPIAIASYDLASRRMDAAVHRIDSILKFASTLTAIIPVVATTALPGLEGLTPWSFLAGVLFVLLFAIGAVATTWGGLRLVNPQELYHKWLNKSREEFQKDLIFFAGEDFQVNTRAVNAKGYAAAWMAWLFLAELVCWALWILR